MEPNILIAVIIASASALVAFLGWMIKYRKAANIISGYDEKLYRDTDGLTGWVGGTLLKTGLAGIVPAIAILIFTQYLPALAIIFGVIIVTGALTAIIGAKKYKVQD